MKVILYIWPHFQPSNDFYLNQMYSTFHWKICLDTIWHPPLIADRDTPSLAYGRAHSSQWLSGSINGSGKTFWRSTFFKFTFLFLSLTFTIQFNCFTYLCHSRLWTFFIKILRKLGFWQFKILATKMFTIQMDRRRIELAERKKRAELADNNFRKQNSENWIYEWKRISLFEAIWKNSEHFTLLDG